MERVAIKTLLLVTLAMFGSTLAKRTSVKTKMDLRVVRSPYPHYESGAPYVLSPSYRAEIAREDNAAGAEQSGHQQVSVISEAHYDALLKQAQKALKGYDLSKLTPTAKTEAESSQPAEAPQKPQMATKYVYVDVPVYQMMAPAVYSPPAYSKVEEEHGYENYSKHKFGYRVHDPHTGAAFGHSEVSEGHVTRGHYHVLLPDGRLQNVKYVADPSGYHATVTYESYKQY